MSTIKISQLPAATTPLTGAELVPVVQSGVTKNVATAALTPLVDIKSFGAKGDGVTDDTAAINAAIASGAPALYISPGTYKITSTITVNRDIALIGAGPSSVFDVSLFPAETEAFLFQGAGATLIEANATAILAGQRRYTFSSANHGLQVGDLVAIWDDTPYSYSSYRPYYYKGEYMTVFAVTGALVTFSDGFYDDYGATTSKFYKVSTVSVVLKDFSIVGAGNPSAFYGAFIDYGRDCVIDNVNFNLDRSYAGLALVHSYNVSVSNSTSVLNRFASGYTDSYPFLIANSQAVRLSNSEAAGRWHAVAVGGFDNVVNIVNREIIVNGCTLSSFDGIFAGDFHGNTEHSTYANCVVKGSGFLLGGDYNSFINNKIMDIERTDVDYVQSLAFYGGETLGYNFTITGNIVECAGSYTTNGFGKFLDIQKIGSANREGNMIIANNNVLFLSQTLPFNDFLIFIYDLSANNPDKVNILIEGNAFYNSVTTVAPSHTIRITTDDTDAADNFKSVVIRGNTMEKIGINVDHISDLTIDGNEISNSWLGIQLLDIGNCVVKNNNIFKTQERALYIANTFGDYVIVNDNVFFESFQDATLNVNNSESGDVFLSTTTAVPYVRFAGNYIKCNGVANQAVNFYATYGLQEFNNRVDGSGALRKVWHVTQDPAGSQLFVGGESETTREFYHFGTTQTDFCVITFGNVGVDGSVLVRLHISNNVAGYTGVLEFGLEGDSLAVNRVNTTYTSTDDPIADGRVIVNIATNVVTLSIDDVAADNGSHVKAEIIKITEKDVLRELDVNWLV
jgi:parallel beta-helix repeat protein